MGLLLNGAGIETSISISEKQRIQDPVWACSLTERALRRHSFPCSDYIPFSVWACSLTERALRLRLARIVLLQVLINRMGLLLNGAGIETLFWCPNRLPRAKYGPAP